MKALSVRQPWAWAITAAGKDVENRSWTTGYRGLVAIHAPLTAEDPAGLPLRSLARAYRADQGFPAAALGAVVAVAEVTGCHRHDRYGEGCGHDRHGALCSPWWAASGQWHWQLAHVRPLTVPVRCRGALGLWQLSADAEHAVCRQLDRAGGTR